MQTYFDCYTCVLRQAIEAARMSGASPLEEKAILKQTLSLLSHIPEGATPPGIGARAHRVAREVTGRDDPYIEVKHAAADL